MLVQRLIFRPCLTHWKNSAMRTTLVVRVQPCPFILRLLSFTLLTGLVNMAVNEINTVKSANVCLCTFAILFLILTIIS